jgi:hypothetical protein
VGAAAHCLGLAFLLAFLLVELITLAGEAVELGQRPFVDDARVEVEPVGDRDGVPGDALRRARPRRERPPDLPV